MPVNIVPYEVEHVEAVKRFNRRMAAGGSRWRFPESPEPAWLPRRPGVPVWQEPYVVVDDGEVRGGYISKPQAYHLHGERVELSHFQLPVSEGTIDARYGLVGARMLRHALKDHPMIFGLGMGTWDAPVAQLLRAARFEMTPCPFHFRVLRPNRFLREISVLRTTVPRRLTLDLLAATGAGWLALKAFDGIKTLRAPPSANGEVELVENFGDGVDQVWAEACPAYACIAERSSAVLNAMFPPGDERYLRLQVGDAGASGWAVLSDTQMTGHRQFGGMRVGAIIDCLATPGHEPAVVAAAERALVERGVDIIVSNQMSERWTRSFDARGFVRGPSNFYFAASQALAKRLAPLETSARQAHLTRGDGDGPVHLVPGFSIAELVLEP